MENKFGNKDQWEKVANTFLNTPKNQITQTELKSAMIGVRSFNKELSDKLQKRIDNKDYATPAQVKKLVLGKQLNEIHSYAKKCMMDEALILKRSEDKIYVLPDDPENRSETFRNKYKLKQAGFRWDDGVSAWGISIYKLKKAQETIAKINKSPITKFLDKVEDLPEFIADTDDFSKKAELFRKTENFIDKLSTEIDDVKASEEFRKYLSFSIRLRSIGVKGDTNLMLIYLQNPNATHVMSKTRWEELHRRIKKESFGKKAIWLYVRKKYKKKDGSGGMNDMGIDDDVNGGMNDMGIDDDVKQHNVGYWTVYPAYDVADTEAIDEKGELPPTPTWHGNDTPQEKADNLIQYAIKFADDNAISVSREASKRGEKGWAKGDHLNVNSDIAGVGALGTMIHEIAHSLMHFKKSSIFFVQSDKPLSSEEKELQAESVSYVVLKHYDLPAQHHSTYLALWRANKDALNKSLKYIKNVSAYIIQGIDKIAEESENTTDKTQLGEENLNIEVIYKNNVGITELMSFYKKAPQSLIDKVDNLFKTNKEDIAWRVVLRFLKKNNELEEISWKDVKKGAIGVGLAGLMATGSAGATGKKIHIPSHKTPSSIQQVKFSKEKRGIRNNNPGNIKKSNTKWQGKIGEDGKFEIFDTPENGIRALTRIIKTYNNKYKLNTISGIITKWAPPRENDTKTYIKNVSNRVGINPNDKINVNDKTLMSKLIKAIIQQENGNMPYDDSVILSGVNKA